MLDRRNRQASRLGQSAVQIEDLTCGIAVNVAAPGPIETDFGGGLVRDNKNVPSLRHWRRCHPSFAPTTPAGSTPSASRSPVASYSKPIAIQIVESLRREAFSLTYTLIV